MDEFNTNTMNGKTAKKILLENVTPKMEELGFKEKKNRIIDTYFIREKDHSYEKVYFCITPRYPYVTISSGGNIYINAVEDVLQEIDKKFTLGLNIYNETRTMIYLGNRNKVMQKFSELRDDEKGVLESTVIALKHIEQEVVPFFDLFDDLKEIDSRINGEEENFREGDTGNKNTYSFGQYFHERRLIIAWLCSNINFEVLVDRTFKYYEKSMKEHTGEPYIYDRIDLSLSIPATVKYLKEHISPIK